MISDNITNNLETAKSETMANTTSIKLKIIQDLKCLIEEKAIYKKPK